MHSLLLFLIPSCNLQPPCPPHLPPLVHAQPSPQASSNPSTTPGQTYKSCPATPRHPTPAWSSSTTISTISHPSLLLSFYPPLPPILKRNIQHFEHSLATSPNHTLQLLSFSIPPTANTCQHLISDPACSLTLTSTTSNQTSYGPIQLSITSLLANSVPSPRSYNDIFPSLVASKEWGTVTLAQGDEGKVVNSGACPEEGGMAHFVVDYEFGGSGVEEGYEVLGLLQHGKDEMHDLNGVYMTYC